MTEEFESDTTGAIPALIDAADAAIAIYDNARDLLPEAMRKLALALKPFQS